MNLAHDAESGCARAPIARGAILFDSHRLAQVDASILDPSGWERSSAEAARGGRGTVWFGRVAGREVVLRHYRRGGLMARINRDRYLWSGEERTRSFREFRLLQALRARELPVPVPLAAGYRRCGMHYRGDILLQRIPDARTLAERLDELLGQTAFWTRLGELLVRFHRAGAVHADLNAHNVLIDADAGLWLIDFDRGRLGPVDAGAASRSMARLQRSLLKLGAADAPGWSEARATLLRTHADGMKRA